MAIRDSSKRELATALGDVLTTPGADLIEVNGLYFRDKEIHLDGYRFSRCRFDNCKLRLASADFEIDHSVIDPTCRVAYGGRVIRVLQLFFNPWKSAPAEWMTAWIPTVNEDGTVTINGDYSK